MSADVRQFRAPVSEAELHAYVDGELGPERSLQVEVHLAAHRDKEKQVFTYRQQKRLLHSRFDGALKEPLPAPIEARAATMQAATKPGRLMMRMARIAACIGLLVAGGAGGWWAQQDFQNDGDRLFAFARNAADSHSVASGVQYASIDTAGLDRQSIASWFSGHQFDGPVDVPDLEALGYRLIRADILPMGRKPTMLLRYQAETGGPVSLFVASDENVAQQAFAYHRAGQASLLYWRASSFAYVLVGQLAEGDLLALAQLITAALPPTEAVREPSGSSEKHEAEDLLETDADTAVSRPAIVNTKSGESSAEEPATEGGCKVDCDQPASKPQDPEPSSST